MAVWQNLHERTCDGSTVALDYHKDERTNEATVRVSYHSAQTDFILYPPNDKALDAFYHPFVYLNRVLQRGSYSDHSDATHTRYAQTL